MKKALCILIAFLILISVCMTACAAGLDELLKDYAGIVYDGTSEEQLASVIQAKAEIERINREYWGDYYDKTVTSPEYVMYAIWLDSHGTEWKSDGKVDDAALSRLRELTAGKQAEISKWFVSEYLNKPLYEENVILVTYESPDSVSDLSPEDFPFLDVESVEVLMDGVKHPIIKIKLTPKEGGRDIYEEIKTLLEKSERAVLSAEPNRYSLVFPTYSDLVETAAILPFKDVAKESWYFGNVKYALDKNIMKGVADDLFDPEGKLTRAMAVTILYRVAGEPEVTDKNSFSDVSAGTWYTDPVSWAQAKGIVMGRTTTEFDPDGDITRAEFAAILYRYKIASYKTLGATRDGEPTDIAIVPEYAKDAVRKMYRSGIINGRENGAFDPSAKITRAETAAMIERYDETATAAPSGEGNASTIAPDLSYTIHVSSEIVRGVVVSEGVTRQSNPTGNAINGTGNVIPDGVISFYDLKVEEVFKGNLKIGDTVRIFTTALITDPDDEVFPYRLDAGQTGIFCINNNNIWTAPSEGTVYRVVHNGWGVFDKIDENGIYHSTVYDLDPADLPDLIEKSNGSSGSACMTTPDLSFTIYVSSEIVRGTVVAEGETRRSNPTGEGINGMGESIPRDGVISFYDLRVEEVFKGDVRPGDVIRIFSVAPITAPDLEVEDEFPYRLELGQAGIFCIDKDDIWTEPSEGVAYGIVESGRGVFDRVDGNGIYHSFVYDLNPADLPALIAAADEKWAPVYEHYADNPI